jgi:hypothetical protein
MSIFPFILVVFWFASITEVPFLSFSAFFVDRYIVFWQPARIYRFFIVSRFLYQMSQCLGEKWKFLLFLKKKYYGNPTIHLLISHKIWFKSRRLKPHAICSPTWNRCKYHDILYRTNVGWNQFSSGISSCLGLLTPERTQNCPVNLYIFYNLSLVLLTAVVPELGGMHLIGMCKSYGNVQKLKYQLMKFCIYLLKKKVKLSL